MLSAAQHAESWGNTRLNVWFWRSADCSGSLNFQEEHWRCLTALAPSSGFSSGHTPCMSVAEQASSLWPLSALHGKRG